MESCLLDAAKKILMTDIPEEMKATMMDVYFRINTYAWLEQSFHPVEPEDTTGRRNRILKYALPALNAEPTELVSRRNKKMIAVDKFYQKKY